VLHKTFITLDEVLLSERLQSAGYATHCVGKWHLGYVEAKYSPVGRGFDSFYGNSWGSLNHWSHTIPPYWGPVFWEGALDWHADLSDGAGGIASHRHVQEDLNVHSTDVIVRETVRIIAEHVASLDDTSGDQRDDETAEDTAEEPPVEPAPLFLYLPFVAPHAPTQPAPGYTEHNVHIDESLTDMNQPYKRPDATTRAEHLLRGTLVAPNSINLPLILGL